ncbi:hypothetical protein OIU79_026860 [Salix purpurea]|uniref:Uncharacterized protein n=1 Tax=Salix purpurea TaxID=77065 RepID=A0A9Q1A0X0_SALPP|nr:hypothetical protein OIU79_026860 [Salix purpurea]
MKLSKYHFHSTYIKYIRLQPLFHSNYIFVRKF